MKPILFLDRDGVLNHDSPEFIKTPDEWLPIAGVGESLKKLSATFSLFVVSNQSGLAKKRFFPEDLMAIHHKMVHYFATYGVQFEGIFFCPHQDKDLCTCRKPLPGMLLAILRHYPITPEMCYMVGDSLRDLEAAAAANVHPVLVLTGNGKDTASKALPPGTHIINTLADFNPQQ